MLDSTALRALLHYCPETGRFTHLTGPRAGAQAGTVEARGYRIIFVRGKLFKASRLAFLWMTGQWPKNVVDHINGDKGDDRWGNLRDVSLSVNSQNQRRAQRGARSGLLGAYRQTKAAGWFATIQVAGRSRYLGSFPTAAAAHAAYLEAKRRLHPGCTL